jgi:hypothetical protein
MDRFMEVVFGFMRMEHAPARMNSFGHLLVLEHERIGRSQMRDAIKSSHPPNYRSQ